MSGDPRYAGILLGWFGLPVLAAGLIFGIHDTKRWFIPALLYWPATLPVIVRMPNDTGLAMTVGGGTLVFAAWAMLSGRAPRRMVAGRSGSGEGWTAAYEASAPIKVRIDQGLLEEVLSAGVIAQEDAVRTIAKRLAVNTVKRQEGGNPRDAGKPLAVFLAVGPTGVGKTETAKAMAEFMQGRVDSRYEPLVLDMSEFYDKHTAARLVGSPPGYLGSEDPGQLTGAMMKNPYRVVLFDEIEKTRPSVMNTFLQIFDEGRLTDASKGFQVSFANAVIMLTSNLAAEEIGDLMAKEMDAVLRRRIVLDTLKTAGMRPEILARINDVVPYKALGYQDYVRIVAAWAGKLPSKRRPKDPEAFAEGVMEDASDLMPYGVREILRVAEGRIYAANEQGGKGMRGNMPFSKSEAKGASYLTFFTLTLMDGSVLCRQCFADHHKGGFNGVYRLRYAIVRKKNEENRILRPFEGAGG